MRMTWAIWRFWQMRGHLDEGRVRTREVVGLPHAHGHPIELARVYEAVGSIEYWAGNMDSAASYYEQALQVSRDIGDEALIANALYNYSFIYAFGPSKVDVPKATSLLEEALERYRAINDASGVAKVLWGLGNALFATQNYGPAKQRYEEALAMFRAGGDRFHMGWALYELGVARVRLGELAEARLALDEGVALFAEARDVSGVVLILDAVSELSEAEGEMLQAIRLAAAAEALETLSGTNLATLSNVFAGRQRPAHMSAEESAAWAEGQAMTLDQAVACALRHPEAVAPAASGNQ
jgi:tetratricopeptide (TPR) repeat protein